MQQCPASLCYYAGVVLRVVTPQTCTHLLFLEHRLALARKTMAAMDARFYSKSVLQQCVEQCEMHTHQDHPVPAGSRVAPTHCMRARRPAASPPSLHPLPGPSSC
jgi:hypothetical protein